MIPVLVEVVKNIKTVTAQIKFLINMMKYIHLFLLLIISPFIASAQTEGSLKINIDSQLEQVIAKRNELNKSNQTMPGYRVQIFSGSARAEALEVRSKFESLHPDFNSYIIYQQPYFKLRTGDFRTRLEAYKFYKLIQKEYASVFIVKDDIAFPKLVE